MVFDGNVYVIGTPSDIPNQAKSVKRVSRQCNFGDLNTALDDGFSRVHAKYIDRRVIGVYAVRAFT